MLTSEQTRDVLTAELAAARAALREAARILRGGLEGGLPGVACACALEVVREALDTPEKRSARAPPAPPPG